MRLDQFEQRLSEVFHMARWVNSTIDTQGTDAEPAPHVSGGALDLVLLIASAELCVNAHQWTQVIAAA